MPAEQSQFNLGAFVPNTYIFDVSQLYSTEVTSPEFKELLVRLYQNINNINLILNISDKGYYALSEFVNGQLWFPDQTLNSTTTQTPSYRQVFRTVVNFGALPNNALKSVAHNITVDNSTTFTRIYGAASDTTGHTYLPLPYVDQTESNEIQLDVDATNVNITTGSNRTNYNVTYCVLEYIKS